MTKKKEISCGAKSIVLTDEQMVDEINELLAKSDYNYNFNKLANDLMTRGIDSFRADDKPTEEVKPKEEEWEDRSESVQVCEFMEEFVGLMKEDCIKGKMEEKQLLLFNVYHNITRYCSEDTTALRTYLLEGRDEFSKVRGLVNTVLITSDKTLTSYLSEVNAYMQQLADDGILSLTSENELDILQVDEEPNAVFIIVPDERFTRHRFVTLFITQIYKELVEKANLNLRRNQTETAILKRNAYFILDEFGNLPKFDNLESMITVGRSRGIRFLLVLQSFSQMNAKYGRDIADVVKTNCKSTAAKKLADKLEFLLVEKPFRAFFMLTYDFKALRSFFLNKSAVFCIFYICTSR